MAWGLHPRSPTSATVHLPVPLLANLPHRCPRPAVSQASALLGPGMPRVDPAALSAARAGLFQSILIGGVVSDAVQMAAVRRSTEQVRSMAAQVQACLAWAQQNTAAHQQREAALRAQAAATRGELEAARREALAAAQA